MKRNNVFCILLLIVTCSGCALADGGIENMAFLEKQYRYCFNKLDVVFAGDIVDARKIDFKDGGHGYGYSKYDITVSVAKVYKGDVAEKITYTVWYEGKFKQDHKVFGSALFCLSEDGGRYIDEEGFGKFPINDELRLYADLLSEKLRN